MRHSTHPRRNFRVRLACVKHAASVQSEPESNSPVQICVRSLLSRNQNLKDSLLFFPLAIHLSMNDPAFMRSPLPSGAVQTYAPFRLPCQQVFFASGKFLFPRIQPVGAEELYAPFLFSCQLFFSHRKLSSSTKKIPFCEAPLCTSCPLLSTAFFLTRNLIPLQKKQSHSQKQPSRSFLRPCQ